MFFLLFRFGAEASSLEADFACRGRFRVGMDELVESAANNVPSIEKSGCLSKNLGLNPNPNLKLYHFANGLSFGNLSFNTHWGNDWSLPI
jgi:hypothetical protein